MASVRLICCFPFDFISAMRVPHGNASLPLLAAIASIETAFQGGDLGSYAHRLPAFDDGEATIEATMMEGEICAPEPC